jgi:hypothetical protein
LALLLLGLVLIALGARAWMDWPAIPSVVDGPPSGPVAV